MIKKLPPLKEEKKDVSHDIDSLFTSISIKDTIDYILDQIELHNKLKSMSSKLIVKNLLIKLSTEVTYI